MKFVASPTRELPPRARRIPPHMLGLEQALGTTSACAENTQSWGVRIGRWRNYLRVRGEYVLSPRKQPHYQELPPRARRILLMHYLRTRTGVNYLRVRGEYVAMRRVSWLRVELPPRARRIRPAQSIGVAALGTTSACAENTVQALLAQQGPWNYLRVRGEYGEDFKPSRLIWELPPRARRILKVAHKIIIGSGTTSACAENTEQG